MSPGRSAVECDVLTKIVVRPRVSPTLRVKVGGMWQMGVLFGGPLTARRRNRTRIAGIVLFVDGDKSPAAIPVPHG